ncbi:hypothetical protein ABHN84_03840 [Shewanella vesiculosa]|uniref:Uncharacterized protein n=1 Tax=Shewanella vesiculosa TaxID=518738 RepID=A0ABV0FKQ9_9GAMM|nr:hypothetical protein [Shewanella vesiculosa]RPA55614.1 hypothetical protein EGC79_03915 [Shewanella vesiculosa]|tara:strand:+ start:436 stop:1359 length:924 start_codon:yes stop_codon:yes gene_type:complete
MSAYANRAINDYQRKKKLAKVLSENEYQLVQMNSAEFIELYISHKQKQGMTRADAVEDIGIVISQSSLLGKQFWDKNNAKIKTGSGFIPLMTDAVALSALAIEMKRGGSAFSTFKTVTYSGQPYIVFQGYARLRRDLTGTRYLANNPKVVSLGIGKLGALKSITKGSILTILISGAFYSLEQMMNDTKTWHHFVGGMAVDIAIVSASSLITWAAIGITGTAATLTIGSMLVIVVVGVALAFVTSIFIDTNYWSDKISQSLLLAEKNLVESGNKFDVETNRLIDDYNHDPIRFLYKLFGVPYFHGSLR